MLPLDGAGEGAGRSGKLLLGAWRLGERGAEGSRPDSEERGKGGRAGGLQRARSVGGDRGLRGWNQGLAGRDECVEEMGGLRRGSG